MLGSVAARAPVETRRRREVTTAALGRTERAPSAPSGADGRGAPAPFQRAGKWQKAVPLNRQEMLRSSPGGARQERRKNDSLSPPRQSSVAPLLKLFPDPRPPRC